MESVTAACLALALAGPLLVLLLWYLKPERRRFANIVDRIPGPYALPIIGNAFLLLTIERRDIFNNLDLLARTYWPTFRTWNGVDAEIHISDADDIEVILRSTTILDKSSFYDFLHPWLGAGLLTSKGKKWHAHRKLITPTFHFKILENFFNIFVEKSEIMIKKLQKEVGKTEGFDVYPYITLVTLDIICETAMGMEINAQNESYSPYVTAIYDISECTFARMIRPWLHADFTFALSSAGRKYKKDLKTVHEFTSKVIQDKKKALLTMSETKEEAEDQIFGKKKRKAFLDLLLEASQGETPLTDEEIREEVDTFMFEGHDTTSASLCWTLLLLGNYPEVQETVYMELESIFEDSDQRPTMNDIAKMKYLERVIKESLRLYPSVPFIGRDVTEEITLGDYTCPVGSQITVHIYHVHRNPKYFPFPDEFNPDNFLPENVQGRHPFAYIPFSAGSRNCIGQKFAMLEEKTILSYIVRNYKIRAVHQPRDINLLGELVLKPEGGLRLTLEKRRPLN